MGLPTDEFKCRLCSLPSRTPSKEDISLCETCAYFKKQDEKWDAIEKQDQKQRDKKLLHGRYISEGMGDGYAIYTIIGVTPTTVTIKAVTGIGDDWIIPYWGHKAIIDRAYVTEQLRCRDLPPLFGNESPYKRLKNEI